MEEYQILLTEKELDFLRNVLDGLNEMLKTINNIYDWYDNSLTISGINPSGLSVKIFKQYHSEVDGRPIHKDTIFYESVNPN